MILRPACRLLAAPSPTSIVGAAGSPIDPTRIDHAVRLACVGDSITFSAGVRPRSTKAYARAIAWKPDTVHPNAEGATVIGETVYHALTGKRAAPKVPVMK